MLQCVAVMRGEAHGVVLQFVAPCVRCSAALRPVVCVLQYVAVCVAVCWCVCVAVCVNKRGGHGTFCGKIPIVALLAGRAFRYRVLRGVSDRVHVNSGCG